MTEVKKCCAQNFLDLKSSVGRLELSGKLDERTDPALQLQRELQSREGEAGSSQETLHKGRSCDAIHEWKNK
nr:hypothetical protein [Tanacetum cinerariifolium]